MIEPFRSLILAMRGEVPHPMPVNVDIPQEEIIDFCRTRYIRRLSLFGSVLRDDFTAESDVDVLVEFEPGHTPGLAFFTMEADLADILGRKVDLNTPEFISRFFRDRVLKEAEVVYAAS